MAVYFQESRETIDLLRRVVDKLDENNGCISAEDLWDGVQCEPANIRSSDPTVARHGIRQMEGLLAGLHSFASTLASTYKSHISTTRLRVHIPHLTVENLPTEIIHHIVKDTFDDKKPLSLFKYSHISSRIRNIILDSPSLWASIPLSLKLRSIVIRTIISRSAALGLIAHIHLSTENLYFTDGSRKLSLNTYGGVRLTSESALSRLSAMFEHHDRWRQVTLTLYNETAKFIQEQFPRANLTSVRNLIVLEGNLSADFFQKWEIPSLEYLYWNTKLFPPSSMATPKLRTCSLWLSVGNSDLRSIAAFLNAAPGLHTLKLHLGVSADDRDREFQEIRLSCLESLDISFAHDSLEQMGSTPRLLKAILCPGLKHLSLTTATHTDYLDLTEDMRGRYPLLTLFKLWIMGRDTSVVVFDDLLCSLPSTIKKVRLGDVKIRTSRRNSIISNNFYTSYPSLKDLDIENCSVGEESFYANLCDTLRRFCVTLDQFRPCGRGNINKVEKENAILAFRRAGVLVDQV